VPLSNKQTNKHHKSVIASFRRNTFQVTQRQLKKELRLPEFAEVDRVEHKLEGDGRLIVDIVLKNDGAYKCKVSTQDLTSTEMGNGDMHDVDYDAISDDVSGVVVGL